MIMGSQLSMSTSKLGVLRQNNDNVIYILNRGCIVIVCITVSSTFLTFYDFSCFQFGGYSGPDFVGNSESGDVGLFSIVLVLIQEIFLIHSKTFVAMF